MGTLRIVAMNAQGPREHWSGRLGFVLAAAGSAIGLGNIWRFPYVTGQYGGGAFVIVYLAFVLAVGLPVMLCEITLGRRTQRNPVGAFHALQPRVSMMAHLLGAGMVLSGLFLILFQVWGWGLLMLALGGIAFRFGWRLVGAMGVLTGFLILSFYSVVGGWTLGYVWESLAEVTRAQPLLADRAAAAERFKALCDRPAWAVSLQWIFTLLCGGVVFFGIRRGIERCSKILMPLLFLLLVALIVRALTLSGALSGVRYYLKPDFARLTPVGILAAMGQAFFSLSLGMGAIITYGSYVDRRQNLFSSALLIVSLDTLIALLAGLAIFPAVFAQGLQPDQGPGLVFVLLPTVFHAMPQGMLWSALFFLLLVVAAWTSGISLLEVVTAYLVDERHWPRRLAVPVLTVVIGAMGSLAAISVSNWDRLPVLHRALVKAFGTSGESFFGLLDGLTSNWMLPLGGLLICLFAGWVWGVRRAAEELREGDETMGDSHLMAILGGLQRDSRYAAHNSALFTPLMLWGIFVRWVCPVAIGLAFLQAIGLLG